MSKHWALTVVGHEVYYKISVHAQTVDTRLFLSVSNRPGKEARKEEEKVPFSVWGDVWNEVQLLVWQLVSLTEMKRNTHYLHHAHMQFSHVNFQPLKFEGKAQE